MLKIAAIEPTLADLPNLIRLQVLALMPFEQQDNTTHFLPQLFDEQLRSTGTLIDNLLLNVEGRLRTLEQYARFNQPMPSTLLPQPSSRLKATLQTLQVEMTIRRGQAQKLKAIQASIVQLTIGNEKKIRLFRKQLTELQKIPLLSDVSREFAKILQHKRANQAIRTMIISGASFLSRKEKSPEMIAPNKYINKDLAFRIFHSAVSEFKVFFPDCTLRTDELLAIVTHELDYDTPSLQSPAVNMQQNLSGIQVLCKSIQHYKRRGLTPFHSTHALGSQQETTPMLELPSHAISENEVPIASIETGSSSLPGSDGIVSRSTRHRDLPPLSTTFEDSEIHNELPNIPEDPIEMTSTATQYETPPFSPNALNYTRMPSFQLNPALPHAGFFIKAMVTAGVLLSIAGLLALTAGALAIGGSLFASTTLATIGISPIASSIAGGVSLAGGLLFFNNAHKAHNENIEQFERAAYVTQ